MGFFRKKVVEEPKKARTQSAPESLSEIVHERVLTAEGWRRKTLKQAPAKKLKS